MYVCMSIPAKAPRPIPDETEAPEGKYNVIYLNTRMHVCVCMCVYVCI